MKWEVRLHYTMGRSEHRKKMHLNTKIHPLLEGMGLGKSKGVWSGKDIDSTAAAEKLSEVLGLLGNPLPANMKGELKCLCISVVGL